jgi:glycosyltransferase involved in cell wall biosynthesis
MKVLHVINSLATGGAEKLILETFPLYKEKGLEIDVLVLNGLESPFIKQLNKLNCCNIYSLKFKSVYNPMAIFKIIPYLRNYNLIHVHLFPAQYWVVFAKLLSFSKVKLLFTEHSTYNRRREIRSFKFLDRIIYSFFNRVICITNEVKDNLQKHIHSNVNNLLVIENGVNIAILKSTNSYSKNQIHKEVHEDDVLIIQVSGFRDSKDQPTLIQAMSFLPNNYKLLLVGEGIMRKKCEALTQELQLQKRVLFLGIRMDVPQLLKTADISVLSSHWEGFGLVAIESMASGKPLIVSDVPGLSGVVAGAGILFEHGNSLLLANEIKNLIDNPDYYESVVTACQERANQFDIKIMVDKHIQLYDTII